MDPLDPGRQDLLHWYGERIVFLDGDGKEQTHQVSHYDAGSPGGSCTLCHGASLEGGKGPACTDCHVVQAAAISAPCSSCHGMPVGPTADFIERVGRLEELEGNAVYRAFVAEVARGFHLKHDAIACEDRDSALDCRTCHGTTRNVDRHHKLVGGRIVEDAGSPVVPPRDGHECVACHEPQLQPITDETGFSVVRECSVCHGDIQGESCGLPAVPFVRGNADSRDAINISDGIFVLNYLFHSGAPPPCLDAADIDDNGSVHITDAVGLLHYLFLGSSPPAAPFPQCGSDSAQDDGLTCRSFPACNRP